MSKLISKAEEILAHIKEIAENPNIIEAKGLEMHTRNRVEGCAILLDSQMLFFSDSPQNPLYLRALELDEYRKRVMGSSCDHFSQTYFHTLETLLLKFVEYRHLLES